MNPVGFVVPVSQCMERQANMSSLPGTSKSKRAERIHERFERDFVPRYGVLWRSMIPTLPSGDKKPDFLDAIQSKGATHIKVQSGSGACECGECQHPILEWEERREPDDNSDDGSSRSAIDPDDFSEESSPEDQKAPGTPLPTDLEGSFGRLNFEDSLIADQGGNGSNDHREKGAVSEEDVASGGLLNSSSEKCGSFHTSDEVASEELSSSLDCNGNEYLKDDGALVQDDSSSSSTSSGYHVDFSEFSPSSHGLAKAKGEVKKRNERIVINLVDFDDDEDDSDFVQPLRKSTNSGSFTSNALGQSSEDEGCRESFPARRRAVRKRVQNKTLYVDSDSSDDGSEVLSDFSSEADSEDNFGTSGRLSTSKLVKTPNRQDQDTENWNPNRAKLPTAKSVTTFKKNRDTLSTKYFDEYNQAVFDGKLAKKVEIVWSNKLRTTAGLTRLKRRRDDFTPGMPLTRLATIELSTKVLNDPERLASTLLHEMVHAAAWIVDDVSKPPHGACFKKWANLAMRKIPGSQVTTTHDYQIEYKYAWACSNSNCKFLVQRHSRSIDVKRQCCGRCRGRLIEVEVPGSVQDTIQKTPKKRAQPSGYNLFVKEHSKAVREKLSSHAPRGAKVGQVQAMKECARLWREQKAETASRVE